MPTIEVDARRLAELINVSSCTSLGLLEPSALHAMIEESPEIIQVGIGRRSTFRGTYGDRYSISDDFRNNRLGWSGFFGVLDEDDSPIGLFSLRGGGWSLIGLIDENVESVVAALVRPPLSHEWPQGTERA
ncbi:hypothetical protein [Streptomyces griseoloalbus]|uniref:Uncharacterized protein n=1 Tax=Streptomyces griseoloalbus TaxID=67303 RepID=A0A7W8FC24_9ACTN|nr:hypothetical protein [Streptomyces albaduncus]MBB5128915.1 hypothetical protein [Streptomyces albaduncus]GGW42908.1 hypothetical protein GCM10010340_21180 [Streptomyces albaduncus]